MKKFTRLALVTIALFTVSFTPYQDDFCGITNTAFKAGEVVTMKVYYSAMGAYIGAGEASFTTTLERFNG